MASNVLGLELILSYWSLQTTAGAQAGAGAAVLPGFGRSHSTSSLTALRRHGSLRAAGFPDFSLQLSPGLVKQAEEMVRGKTC